MTFPLRQGVKWHDGKPFTATDVKCTWELLLARTAQEKLRVNPRKSWYRNLDSVTTNGDYEYTFHLKRPQPAFLSLLAAGWSPVYPCHVSPREMRTRPPIGTGPFKFADFRPNEVIKTVRNPDYWEDRPYLDGIEWQIMKIRRRAIWRLSPANLDVSSPYGTTVPLLNDVKAQRLDAVCVLTSTKVSRNLIINREKPPFDNPELRRAMALTLGKRSSTFWGRARGILVRRCCRHPRACGACRPKC